MLLKELYGREAPDPCPMGDQHGCLLPLLLIRTITLKSWLMALQHAQPTPFAHTPPRVKLLSYTHRNFILRWTCLMLLQLLATHPLLHSSQPTLPPHFPATSVLVDVNFQGVPVHPIVLALSNLSCPHTTRAVLLLTALPLPHMKVMLW